MDSRAELREFLRSRRARLQPEQVGLPPHPGKRRVPGLRREEVAQLIGLSVDYYVRLEQGRGQGVSETVLAAVARALRLDTAELAHLFDLAKPTKVRRRAAPTQHVRPGMLRLLETLDGAPALILGRRLDVLAANRLARALMVDFDALPPEARNLMRYMFLDPGARERYRDWDDVARDTLAVLRLDACRHPDDPKLSALVGELTMKSPEFSRWWAEHDVRERTYGTKRYYHPLVGEITIAYEAFQVPGDADQTLFIYTVEAGSSSALALQRLADQQSEAQAAEAGVLVLAHSRL